MSSSLNDFVRGMCFKVAVTNVRNQGRLNQSLPAARHGDPAGVFLFGTFVPD
jgi:hypothetical protein